MSDSPCRLANKNVMPTCGSRVNYQIPFNWTESFEDSLASAEATSAQASGCPYYDSLDYQCRKHFPKCIQTQTTPVVGKVLLICTSSCLSAATAGNGLCKSLGQYYFDNECHQPNYDSPNDSNCENFIFDNSADGAFVWKVVLGSVLGFVGVIILISVLRQVCRERLSVAELDAEAAENQEKALKQQQSINQGYTDINSQIEISVADRAYRGVSIEDRKRAFFKDRYVPSNPSPNNPNAGNKTASINPDPGSSLRPIVVGRDSSNSTSSPGPAPSTPSEVTSPHRDSVGSNDTKRNATAHKYYSSPENGKSISSIPDVVNIISASGE